MVTVTTERQENCIVNLTITVDEQRTQDILRRAARTLSRNYRIPGFRPGKAPYNVVVRHLGIEAVRAQAVEQFGDRIFQEGLEKSGLEPVDQASLQDVTWEPFTLHLKVPVGPEVYLGDYRSVRVEWEEPQVTDEDVEEELRRIQERYAEWVEKDRPAQIGDRVVLDIIARVGDQTVLENVEREMILNEQSPYPVPGFANEIVGMRPGEKREFTLVYPEDHYNRQIAGQEARFEVFLHKVLVEEVPPLDDEFAAMVGDYDDLESLKAEIRQELLEMARDDAESAFDEAMWEGLFEVASIEYPEAYVERELEDIQEQIEQFLAEHDLDRQTYFDILGTTEEEWLDETRARTEEGIKRTLFLTQLIEEENITVDDGEIDAEIERIASNLDEEMAARARQELDSPEAREKLAGRLLLRKALDLLRAIARGEAPEVVGEGEGESEAEGTTEAAVPSPAADDGIPTPSAGDTGVSEGADATTAAASDAEDKAESSVEDGDE